MTTGTNNLQALLDIWPRELASTPTPPPPPRSISAADPPNQTIHPPPPDETQYRSNFGRRAEQEDSTSTRHYRDTIRRVEAALHNADMALRDAQAAFQTGRSTRNNNATSNSNSPVVDLTHLSSDSSEDAFMTSTRHPADPNRGGSTLSSANIQSEPTWQTTRHASTVLDPENMSVSLPGFSSILDGSRVNTFAAPGNIHRLLHEHARGHDQRSEEAAVRRQSQARRDWERVERRNRERAERQAQRDTTNRVHSSQPSAAESLQDAQAAQSPTAQAYWTSDHANRSTAHRRVTTPTTSSRPSAAQSPASARVAAIVNSQSRGPVTTSGNDLSAPFELNSSQLTSDWSSMDELIVPSLLPSEDSDSDRDSSAPPSANSPHPEAVDLTAVDSPTTLSQVLAKSQQEAIAAQNKPTSTSSPSNTAIIPTALSQYKCSICMDTPTILTTTICGHLFCYRCITDSLRWSSQLQNGDRPPGARTNKGLCPVCRHKLDNKEVNSNTRTAKGGLVGLIIKKVPRQKYNDDRERRDFLEELEKVEVEEQRKQKGKEKSLKGEEEDVVVLKDESDHESTKKKLTKTGMKRKRPTRTNTSERPNTRARTNLSEDSLFGSD